MSATYDPTLPTDRDWVRFLIGDVDVADPALQDEEITAIISDETATGRGLKFFAAARALSVLAIRWASAGEGVLVKTASKLSKTWGFEEGSRDLLEARMKELRLRGAQLISARPFSIRTVGDSNTRTVP